MQDFIQDERFLDGLRNELSDLICCEKNNDLYKFHQVTFVNGIGVVWYFMYK